MNLTNALLRAVPVSVAAALLVAVFVAVAKWRSKPLTAAFEHALWTCVLAAMLAFAAPRVTIHAGPPIIVPAVRHTVQYIAPHATTTITPSALTAMPMSAPVRRAPAPRFVSWPAVWTMVWMSGAILMALRIVFGIFLARRSLTGARSIRHEGAMRSIIPDHASAIGRIEESDNAIVPMTIGWPFARIVLPAAWREWPNDKLRAVVLHECAHVRRRDTLVTFLAAVNKAIFWFHPLAWWLERRLAELAEFAADDAAVHDSMAASGFDLHDYAAILIEIAASARPVRLRLSPQSASVDFARYGVERIKRRLDRIFDGGIRTGSMKVVWAAATLIAILTLVQFQRPVQAAQELKPVMTGSGAAPEQERQKTDSVMQKLDQPSQGQDPGMDKMVESPERVCEIHIKQMSGQDRGNGEAQRAEDECRQVLAQFPASKFAPIAAQELASEQQQQIGDVMKKLEELARRQQELASQERQDVDPQQLSEQRYRAEMLRREAEKLQQEAALQQDQASDQDRDAGKRDEMMQQAVQRLAEKMAQIAAANSQMKMRDLAIDAARLADEQQNFEQQMRKTFGNGDVDQKVYEQMANQQEAMRVEYVALEKQIHEIADGLTNGNLSEVWKQLRDALNQAIQDGIGPRIQQSEQYISRGMGQYSVMREAPITKALNQLREAINSALQSLLDATHQQN